MGAAGEMLVVAREQLQRSQVYSRGPAADLVENGERIEGAEARLEVVGGQPDGVAVGLAGLRAAGLAHVGAPRYFRRAKGDQLAHIRAHLVGDAHDHLEVGAHAGAVGGLLHLLQVAVAIGDRAGFFVKVRSGKARRRPARRSR
jgi:hypothetical protein